MKNGEKPTSKEKNLSRFLDQMCCVARLVYYVLVLNENTFPLQEVHQIANQNKVDLLIWRPPFEKILKFAGIPLQKQQPSSNLKTFFG